MGEKTWLSWTASALSAATKEAVAVLFDALTVDNVPKIQKNTAPISGLRSLLLTVKSDTFGAV